MGGIGGQGIIKMASASILSANEPAKDLILVHTVQPKPMIKTHFLGRMVSSGICDVAFVWYIRENQSEDVDDDDDDDDYLLL